MNKIISTFLHSYIIALMLISFSFADSTVKEDESNNDTPTESKKASGETITKWMIDKEDEFKDVIEDSLAKEGTKWVVKSAKSKDINKAQIDSGLLNGKPVIYYTVQKGDTLYSIASAYKVDLKKVTKLNNIKDTSIVKSGTIIAIPKEDSKVLDISINQAEVDKNQPSNKESIDSNAENTNIDSKNQEAESLDSQRIEIPEYRYHRVANGETLYSIAKKYDMSVEDLYSMNGIENEKDLWKDRILKVRNVSVDKYDYISDSAIRGEEVKPIGPNSNSDSMQGNVDKGESKVKSSEESDNSHKFSWPLVGRILEDYGTHVDGVKNGGINIKAKAGQSVKAAESGIVIYAGDDLDMFGNLLLIQHDKVWVTAYGHLDSMSVKKGDRINKKDVIGKAGSTGYIKEPQLHFEIRKNTITVDPLLYLDSYK